MNLVLSLLLAQVVFLAGIEETSSKVGLSLFCSVYFAYILYYYYYSPKDFSTYNYMLTTELKINITYI